MYPVSKTTCKAFDTVKPRPVSLNTLVSCRPQNDVLSTSKPQDYGEMGDGSLSDQARSQRSNGTRNVFEFGNAVSM